MDRLGKHETSKSCLHIKRLADIEMRALEELVSVSVRERQQRDGEASPS